MIVAMLQSQIRKGTSMTPKRQWQWLGIISVLMILSVIAYCAPPGKFGKPALDITGLVLDKDTNQPIEGAYVIAIYEETAISMAGSGHWCIKTKGMTTGKDGRYNFPVEKLDNASPAGIQAIKPDYYLYSSLAPSAALQRAQSKATYTDRHVVLKRQDPAKPEYRWGTSETICTRAKSREDVDAAITFHKFVLEEQKRFNRPDWQLKNTQEIIQMLEKLPRLQ
jgi:hypothetical protein